MRSLIGVYIGAATTEFGFAPVDLSSCSGTGGANSGPAMGGDPEMDQKWT